MNKPLVCYRRNIYSQNGEDGVIAEICRRLRIESGWFCEFGAWDGRYGSNTYALLKQGWKGLMIEGDPCKFKALERTARPHGGVLCIQKAYVDHLGGDNSLDAILARSPLPRDFDVLSIDIDSYDYHVWDSLANFRPKLVIIEINSSTLPGEEYVYDGSGRLTSFSAMVKLGARKGYALVCHTGNLFFLAREHLAALGIDQRVIDHPESLFIRDWVNPTKAQRWRRKIGNMTWQRALVKLQNLAGTRLSS